MTMAISMYTVHEAERREAAHAEYIAAPEFPGLENAAAARGYRHATISEIHASAESRPTAPDLSCWRGGLWIASQT